MVSCDDNTETVMQGVRQRVCQDRTRLAEALFPDAMAAEPALVSI
jgi:hypothetical protein